MVALWTECRRCCKDDALCLRSMRNMPYPGDDASLHPFGAESRASQKQSLAKPGFLAWTGRKSKTNASRGGLGALPAKTRSVRAKDSMAGAKAMGPANPRGVGLSKSWLFLIDWRRLLA